MVGCLMNYKLEKMGKEAVVTYLKVSFWYFLGGTDKNHKHPHP
jgi:hypothetical protein